MFVWLFVSPNVICGVVIFSTAVMLFVVTESLLITVPPIVMLPVSPRSMSFASLICNPGCSFVVPSYTTPMLLSVSASVPSSFVRAAPPTMSNRAPFCFVMTFVSVPVPSSSFASSPANFRLASGISGNSALIVIWFLSLSGFMVTFVPSTNVNFGLVKSTVPAGSGFSAFFF